MITLSLHTFATLEISRRHFYFQLCHLDVLIEKAYMCTPSLRKMPQDDITSLDLAYGLLFDGLGLSVTLEVTKPIAPNDAKSRKAIAESKEIKRWERQYYYG
ncbi:hypothetical protein [Janthinobacterium sp. B9-8]|uniref:hypothetical protein n=1 Tax=Janthinobacterium sp. B9-8 TaxID=1236179 RepID=UPI00061D25F1|nr:hypothetical protein [Janthinobacterium sp. B9-8]AMC35236.1 hypothetical protein VN23_11740 [Janthinobacterium sp. B9-8]